MLQSSAFDYINVLDKAADASWLRESTIANNIANATTPEYKRHDVDFQSLLERELMDSKFNRNLDKKIHNVNLDRQLRRSIWRQSPIRIVWTKTMWIYIRKTWSWLPSRSVIRRLRTVFHRSSHVCVQQ